MWNALDVDCSLHSPRTDGSLLRAVACPVIAFAASQAHSETTPRFGEPAGWNVLQCHRFAGLNFRRGERGEADKALRVAVLEERESLFFYCP